MTESNSTAPRPKRKPHSKHAKRKKRRPGEPAKPYKDFPLFTVASSNGAGRWAKKILGKLHYFGSWEDGWQAALDKYNLQKEDLHAGRVPRGDSDGLTLRTLVNKFLTVKKSRETEGGLSPHTWNAYDKVCGELIEAFGADRLVSDLRPDDFETLRQRWSAKWGVVKTGAEINRARVIFNYAAKNDLIDKPLKFGDGFQRPSKRQMQVNKMERGPKSFQADELRRMIEAASQPLKSMLLLGINGALGNTDIALMPLTALDLKAGWLTYPRQKTAVIRRIPLWPETVRSLKEWLDRRPAPRDEADVGLVFLTVRGASWGRSVDDRPITHECRKLLDKLKIGGNRGFYGCRHTFENVGGESRDQVAVDAIMGHTTGAMAENYRELARIGDDRLKAVTEFVQKWLFGAAEGRNHV